jgi:tetratricopeptide (TPR) repeat protein
MPLQESDDFGAKDYDGEGGLKVHDHLFPSANTGVPHLLGFPDWVEQAHRDFNDGVMRVDLFGVKEGGVIDGPLTAPLRPEVPVLVAGKTYLLEAVVRTMKMGHVFTQGTSDSNEVWVDAEVTGSGGELLGRSGGMGPDGRVDPWSHFVNSYVLNRDGQRVDRRNAQDIFVPLYSHQIPPGAADVVHYRFTVPPDARGTITVEVGLNYRKFDTTYLKYVYGPDYVNDLPVMDLARDRVTFPVAPPGAAPSDAAPPAVAQEPSAIPEWQRWNDYGIALLLKGGKSKGELRQAEEAFRRVEALGRPDGPLNLARVYLAQGTVRDQAIDALARAAAFEPPAPAWSVAWFTAAVNKQNGFLDEAVAELKSIVELDDAETRERGFDFSQDWRVLTELGQTILERAKQERGAARRAQRDELTREAVGYLEQALVLDPEWMPAHFNLYLAYRTLGEKDKADEHFRLYQKYRPDDNARDRAVSIARAADPAADHAAEAIAIYDLQRPGAYELSATPDPVPPPPPSPDHLTPDDRFPGTGPVESTDAATDVAEEVPAS